MHATTRPTLAALALGFAGLYPSIVPAEAIGTLDLTIAQNGAAITAERIDGNRYRAKLARQPFELRFGAQDLGICASTKEDVFELAPTGTDSMKDFASCMNMFKAFAMDADGGSLIVDSSGANWLNAAHGTHSDTSGKTLFTVKQFTGKETGDIALSDANDPIYLMIWDDKDRDKKIGPTESLRLEIHFQ